MWCLLSLVKSQSINIWAKSTQDESKTNNTPRILFTGGVCFDAIDRLFQRQQTPGRGIGQDPMRHARDERLLDILGLVVVIGYRDGKT
jgi:hypothetical protein